ncbi:MAG: hypothetical protein HRT59_25395, partial [Crocosphaera sp.]|nr:hypothetical protein [Crocosphaera sp.]
MLRIKQLTFVIVGIGIGYLINPTTTYSFTLSSLDLNLVEGALGLPDLDNYLSSFNQLYS